MSSNESKGPAIIAGEKQPTQEPKATVVAEPTPVPPTPLFDTITLAGASVSKSSSFMDGGHNQDAVSSLIHESGNLLVAAVFDGCGTQPNSHVGASLGGEILLRKIYDAAVDAVITNNGSLTNVDLKAIQTAWGETIRSICDAAGGDDWATEMQGNFQFTVVGVIMTLDETMTFHCGDGYIALNQSVTKLEKENDNKPYYPIYPFVENMDPLVQQASWIVTDPIVKTDSITSLVMATDGGAFLPNGVDSMEGYHTTSDLEAYLLGLQKPRLEVLEGKPEVTPTISSNKPFDAPDRITTRISGSVSFTSTVEAGLTLGRASDDMAVVVITKKGRVARSAVSTTTQSNAPDGDGGLSALLGTVTGWLSKKGG